MSAVRTRTRACVRPLVPLSLAMLHQSEMRPFLQALGDKSSAQLAPLCRDFNNQQFAMLALLLKEGCDQDIREVLVKIDAVLHVVSPSQFEGRFERVVQQIQYLGEDLEIDRLRRELFSLIENSLLQPSPMALTG